MMRRIAITGSSGYYGRKLTGHIRQIAPEAKVLGIDVVPPPNTENPDEYLRLDIRSPDVRQAIADFQPDTIVHLAFVVNPIRDTRLMHDINVGGTNNVFEAVRAVRPQRFLMSSSSTAYGAWPDNPIPMEESWPLRAQGKFQYALDKTLLEELILALSKELPDVAVSWTRPAIIGGVGLNNFLTRCVCRLPLLVLPDGKDVPLQFVHESDVVKATWAILENNVRGPFNIAPPDWIPLSEIAKLTNRWSIKAPFWTTQLATTIWWGLRLPVFDFPPSFHDFVRHQWVIAPARLQRELNFKFQYSAKETLLMMWAEDQRLRGK